MVNSKNEPIEYWDFVVRKNLFFPFKVINLINLFHISKAELDFG